MFGVEQAFVKGTALSVESHLGWERLNLMNARGDAYNSSVRLHCIGGPMIE
jgi:hypothetical protein